MRTIATPLLKLSDLADLAESLRQQGRYDEACKTVEDCLKQNPRHPRALLLLARLRYQQGRLLEARESLGALDSIVGGDEALKAIGAALERLRLRRDGQTDNAFVTETMAGLLAEQGYFLEAMGIYRQLFVACGGEKRLWEKILSLRERLGQEGSRDAGQEKVAEQLEALDRWIEAQQRED